MDIGLEPTHCGGQIAVFTAMPLNTFGSPAVGLTRLSSTCEILHILLSASSFDTSPQYSCIIHEIPSQMIVGDS